MDWKKFDARIKLLPPAKRTQLLCSFLLSVLRICLPVIIASCLLVFILVLLYTGFGIRMPIIPLLNVIAILSIITVSFLAFKKLPNDEKLITKLEDLENSDASK